MKTATVTGPYTFEDLCALVKDGDKADLIDGVIYMASPDNTSANELFVWIIGLMGFFVEATVAGKVYGSRVALRLDDRNGPEPDIAFVRKTHLHLVKGGHIAGPADLTMEIVSPDSTDRDYHKKRRQYERARVPEYWIVDPLREKLTVLRLGPGGKYTRVQPRKGELHSRALPGFWVRPEWLWQEARPNMATILAELLGRLS
jgi:Uma2 family endonuclease